MKKLALLLAVSLTGFLVGCGDNKPAAPKPTTTAPATEAAKPADGETKPADEAKK